MIACRRPPPGEGNRSRRRAVPLAVIPPCIDAFAPKNQPMAPPTVSAILQAAGILDARNRDLPALDSGWILKGYA